MRRHSKLTHQDAKAPMQVTRPPRGKAGTWKLFSVHRGSNFKDETLKEAPAALCSSEQVPRMVEDDSLGERAISSAAEGLEDCLFPLSAVWRKLKYHAAAVIVENVAALMVCSTGFRGAVEIADLIHDQRAVGKFAVQVCTGKAVKHARPPRSRDMRELECGTEILGTAVGGCAEEIAVCVDHQGRDRICAVGSVQTVNYGFSPNAGVVCQLEDHAAAAAATLARTTGNGRAIEIALRVKRKAGDLILRFAGRGGAVRSAKIVQVS